MTHKLEKPEAPIRSQIRERRRRPVTRVEVKEEQVEVQVVKEVEDDKEVDYSKDDESGYLTDSDRELETDD